ncbi:MAG TPA: 3-hydroxyacyl-CoA dehydrogenase NAD-binding domain-containing protein, partial [Bacillales bacterium]
MQAVHFGAGNIGRGFIGSLLHKAGYHVCFVDVNDEIVSAINERKSYEIVLAGESEQTETIKDISALNSQTQRDETIDAIANADLVTTAVGPNILEMISDLIAEGLRKRSKNQAPPLNVIACENAI